MPVGDFRLHPGSTLARDVEVEQGRRLSWTVRCGGARGPTGMSCFTPRAPHLKHVSVGVEPHHDARRRPVDEVGTVPVVRQALVIPQCQERGSQRPAACAKSAMKRISTEPRTSEDRRSCRRFRACVGQPLPRICRGDTVANLRLQCSLTFLPARGAIDGSGSQFAGGGTRRPDVGMEDRRRCALCFWMLNRASIVRRKRPRQLPDTGSFRTPQILGYPQAAPPFPQIIPHQKSCWCSDRTGPSPKPAKLGRCTMWWVEDSQPLIESALGPS